MCGMQKVEDVESAVANGAGYIGFVIEYPKSPRSVDRKTVADIIRKTNRGDSLFAGVFVDVMERDVFDIAKETGIQIIQLHGSEGTRYIERIKLSAGLPVWKYIELRDENDLSLIQEYRGTADKVIIDRGKGSGEAIGLELLRKAVEMGVDGIAGGVAEDNVVQYIQKYRPEIIDVSSGIEKERGVKDIGLIERFMNKVKETYV